MAENKIRFPSFIGPSNPMRVTRFDSQRTVNMYLEASPLGAGKGQEVSVLVGTPGLTLLYEIDPVGPIRAIYSVSNSVAFYVVSGSGVYLFASINSEPIYLGALSTSFGYVSVSDNGTVVMFVDGTINGFYSPLGSTQLISINTGVTTFSGLVPGTGYADGTWSSVPLSGGTGVSVTADITIAGGLVTSVVLPAVPAYGIGYTIGDTLTASNSYIGGTGSGFSINVATLGQPNFYAANQVTYQDTYFIFSQPNSQNIFVSDSHTPGVTTPPTFSPLNYSIKEGNPDNVNGIISNNRELYIFGGWDAEIWWNAGTGFPPFQRQDGKFSQIGCISPASIARLTNTIIWLGTTPQGSAVIYMMQNDAPVRISNHAVEFNMNKLSAGQLAYGTAYSWQVEGHFFYVFNCVGLNSTWFYDVSTGEWSEQTSSINGVIGRHLAQYHVYVDGVHIVGDYQSGNIYKYDYSNYTDNGAPIQRIRQCPHISENLNMIFYKLFQVDFSPGVGVVSGSSNAVGPTIWLEISNDGGMTFGSPMEANLGMSGDYYSRARWQQLGSSRDRVYRVSCTDPIQFNLLSAYMDVEVGNA